MHLQVAEDGVSVLFQSVLEEDEQQFAPHHTQPASRQEIISLPRICSIFETAGIKIKNGLAVEEGDSPSSEMTFTELFKMFDSALAKYCKI